MMSIGFVLFFVLGGILSYYFGFKRVFKWVMMCGLGYILFAAIFIGGAYYLYYYVM